MFGPNPQETAVAGMFTWQTTNQEITTIEASWPPIADKSKFIGEHTITIQAGWERAGTALTGYDTTQVLAFKLIIADPCIVPNAISFIDGTTKPFYYGHATSEGV